MSLYESNDYQRGLEIGREVRERRERLENLGARLEIAMAKALLREVNREMLLDAGQRVADIRAIPGEPYYDLGNGVRTKTVTQIIGEHFPADKPLDEEGL